jgi:CRISPR-associated endonuclease/helicase Cas3
MIERVLLCWGKTSSESDAHQFHPALFHMIDVGHVAQALLSDQVSPRWGAVLASAFGDEPRNLRHWLPWVVAMHDIGKISSSFQAQVKSQIARLTDLGFPLRPILEVKHPIVGAYFVKKTYRGVLPRPILTALCEMAGGHHGQFPSTGEVNDAGKRLDRDEHPQWINLRQEAAQYLQKLFLDPAISWPSPVNISSAVMALCGFTVLCDWIGSNSAYFEVDCSSTITTYPAISLERAKKAVLESGFCQPWVSQSSTAVSQLFSNLPSLRPLQLAIDRIPAGMLSQPCLAIIEAPTGEGKTEAALSLAHRIGAARGSDEIYYALPTAATSNQMYRRLSEYLSDRLGLSTLVKLVHSQAFLIEDEITLKPLTNGASDPTTQAAIEWFSSKKRALLAPFGVGTIDQAELGALNVRHNMLRLVGLAGKVVILDEVHAYDTYMTTIIERLLAWLSALGASVIILSATLPQSRRERLARAYGVALSSADTSLDHYPCLFIGNSAGCYSDSPAASQPNCTVQVQRLQLSSSDPDAQARWLLGQLGDEGCACWITNTIDRAQKLFERLDEIAPKDTRLTLIHSRFAVDDRQALEEELIAYYGPNKNRPRRGIVIGTQVLEQSLDLDFDLMVSDLAPVDLLLQRAGRLHRHQRQRPARHVVPCLWVNSQPGNANYPDLTTDGYIYDKFLLMTTWNALQNRTMFDLPADYRVLIKAVYDADQPDPSDDRLLKAWKDLQKRESHERGEAANRLLPLPSPSTSFSVSTGLVFEEDEDKASWVIAKTRLGDESITIVPMCEIDGFGLCHGVETPIPLAGKLSKEIELQLLRRSLKLSGKDLCAAIRSQNRPLAFTESPLLKSVYPLWMSGNRAVLNTRNGAVELTLLPKLGLVINRQKG